MLNTAAKSTIKREWRNLCVSGKLIKKYAGQGARN